MNRAVRHRGFTLVEMLVASTIAVLIAGSTVGLLNGLIGARQRIEREMTLQQEARTAVRAIESALRNALQVSDDKGLLLEGIDEAVGPMPIDRIRFRTISLRPLRLETPESDWREVEFFVRAPDQPGEHASLMRRLDPTRNPEPDRGGILERVATGIGGLDIQYHDGTGWREEWRPDNTAWPLAIRFSVLVLGGDPEDPVMWSSRRMIGFFNPSESSDELDTGTNGAEAGAGGRI